MHDLHSSMDRLETIIAQINGNEEVKFTFQYG